MFTMNTKTITEERTYEAPRVSVISVLAGKCLAQSEANIFGLPDMGSNNVFDEPLF